MGSLLSKKEVRVGTTIALHEAAIVVAPQISSGIVVSIGHLMETVVRTMHWLISAMGTGSFSIVSSILHIHIAKI